MVRTIFVLLLLSPAPAVAQTVIDAAAFVETATPAGVPAGFGGEVAWGRSVVQLRLSGRAGALDVFGEPRFWQSDVDLKVAPLNVHPFLWAIPPFDAEPYVFVGAGTRVEPVDGGARTAWAPSLSWGAGVRLPVLGEWLALYGEGRNRSGEWDARGGIALRLTFGAGDDALASPREPETRASPGPDASDLAGSVLAEAERHLGVPYVWGGSDPETGFDCSGFVKFVYARVGIQLPRVTRDQARAGAAVPLSRDAFRPGDLLFFASDGRRIDHVAIYAGDGRIIHAPNGSTHVRYDDLRAPEGRWYREHLVAARRVF